MKLLLRVGFLVICLVIALALMNFVSSGSFKKELNDIFTSNVKTLKWCPDHTVDFEWLDSSAAFQIWKDAKPDEIMKNFCVLTVESFEKPNADVEFRPLLKANSTEDKVAILEWNSKMQIFRVQGIVFESVSLMGKEKR